MLGQRTFLESKYLVWFSCGAASAVAAKLAVKLLKDKPVEILYCDTRKYEHPDNTRFLLDVQNWIGQEIKTLKSKEYADIYDVFHKTNYLNGQNGARCTTELKKKVRMNYQIADDVHIFGYTIDEQDRIDEFKANNPELFARFILDETGTTKMDCFRIVQAAGIELPMMYKLGYKNNNCIGCVKGGMGYWNKIRVDFPEMFEKMAREERRLNFALNRRTIKGKEIKVFLDELPPDVGHYESELEIECGVLCQTQKSSSVAPRNT